MSPLRRLKDSAARVSACVRQLLNAQLVLDREENAGRLPSIDSRELCGLIRVEVAEVHMELLRASAEFSAALEDWTEERQEREEPRPYVFRDKVTL